jgi:hypothetical protein
MIILNGDYTCAAMNSRTAALALLQYMQLKIVRPIEELQKMRTTIHLTKTLVHTATRCRAAALRKLSPGTALHTSWPQL